MKVLVLGLITALVACSKKPDSSASSASKPLDIKPLQLFDDLAAVRAKATRVTLTSTVRMLSDKPDEQVMLAGDPDGDRMLSIWLAFAPSAVAKAKTWKRDDSVTVTCSIGKEGASQVWLTDCTF